MHACGTTSRKVAGPTHDGPGETRTTRSRGPTRRRRSTPRTSSGSARRPTCWAATTDWVGVPGAGAPGASRGGETSRAPPGARSGSACTTPPAARWGRAGGWLGRAQRLARARRRRGRRARIPPRAARMSSSRRRATSWPPQRPRAAAADDRRALRRRRTSSPSPRTQQGHFLVIQGARRRTASPSWTRRWSRSPPAELSPIVTRPRLLRGHPRLPRGLRRRAVPRSGPTPSTRWCDAQPDLVAFTGQLPGPPRRDPAASAAPGRRRWRRPRRAAAGCVQGINRAARGAGRSTCRARCTACAATLDAAEEAYRDASRFGLRAAARPRAAPAGPGQAPAPPRRRCAGRSAEATRRPQRARAAARAACEIALAAGDLEAARGGLRASWSEIAGATRHARAAAAAIGAPTAGAPRGWPRATRRGRAARRLRARLRDLAGARRAVRGRAGARARSASPAARSATRTTRRLELERGPRRLRARSARRRTLAGSRRCRRGGRRRHGLTARELEVLRLVAAGKTNREDRRRARHQRAHRRPARAEHLRQARRLLAVGRDAPSPSSTGSL